VVVSFTSLPFWAVATTTEVHPLLEVEELYKSYSSPSGDLVHVLKDVNLKLLKGETLALTGPSGSGKSTLLHILGLLLSPTSGNIFLKKQSIGSLSASDRNRLRSEHLGFVFQKHLLLPELSLLENTCLSLAKKKGWSKAVLDQGRAMLTTLGLDHRQTARPHQLSGGEAQRGAIARALVHEPEILFLDEPTGNLDPSMSTTIMENLLNWCQTQNITCITVTHNLELAGMMSRQVKVVDHQLVET
jgi:ABC-type lipoprotein export system ATPase subunit